MSGRQEIRARRLPLNQRLLLNQTEAAEMLGVSRDTFRDEIAAELRPVRIKKSWHWPVAELERWVDRHMLPADAD
jgi:predicted DNA-binding transcriptional regulator AlpA